MAQQAMAEDGREWEVAKGGGDKMKPIDLEVGTKLLRTTTNQHNTAATTAPEWLGIQNGAEWTHENNVLVKIW